MLIALKNKLTERSSYQFFQLVRVATVILISIILVKFGYDRESVSHFELFIFMANLFSFFWVMGIKNAALAYYPKLPENEKSTFFSNLFLILQSLGVVIALLFIGISSWGWSSLKVFTENGEHYLLAFYLFLYAPTVIIELYLILKKKAFSLFAYSIWIHLVQLLAVVIVSIYSSDLFDLFLVLILWMLIKWIYLLFILSKTKSKRITLTFSLKFFLFSLPLIAHILLGNGMEFIDGLLVDRFFEKDQFAIFRYGARELPFVIILLSALSNTMIPEAVKNWRVASEILKKSTSRLMHLFYPASILLIFISPYLFHYFYSPEYSEAANLFNIYLLIIASRIILAEVFIYAKHLNRILMYVSLGELILNLVLSLILMRIYGLEGIAAATVIAYFLSKIFFVIYIKHKLKIGIKSFLNLPLYLFYSVLLYAAYIINLLLLY